MSTEFILASGSETRAALLRQVGLDFDQISPRIDEDNIKASLLAENATPRDIADTLAEMKSAKVSERHPQALVLGSDQVLVCEGKLFSKPRDLDDAARQLAELSGRSHRLITAAVLCRAGKPEWRHVNVVHMQMRPLSPGFITAYLDRNWPAVKHCVGVYMVEAEGLMLFSEIRGDHASILGLPMIELVNHLVTTGVMSS